MVVVGRFRYYHPFVFAASSQFSGDGTKIGGMGNQVPCSVEVQIDTANPQIA
jgi:hypothetical protein